MAYKKIQKQGYTLYQNENGKQIGTANGKILEQDGLIFKDLAGTGALLPYEDWRLPATERARDLAGRLPVEAIAGLMLYSSHQVIPSLPGSPFPATYGGKSFPESGCELWSMSDQQKEFLTQDNIRHVLVTTFQDTRTAVRWQNSMQACAESLSYGIPVNFSSDPRHGSADSGAEYKTGGGEVSKWPEGIGMAALFDPERTREFARIISSEYRALGITTALGPQIDLCTEPRWMRLPDTMGPDCEMTIRMTKAYCDALQTTEDSADGWGSQSVNAMVKHWPGGGTGEGGRDAHYSFGQFAVYPGGRFEEHMRPFTEGAFALDGPTQKTAAVMPYYTVSWNQDKKNHENVGNSYSEYIIRDLLRDSCGYDGVVCTDWGITQDPADDMDAFGSRCFGTESLSVAERHLRIIMNGVDQFGGNNDKEPILEAYRIGCERYGESVMRRRMEESAVRILTNIFRVGLFENPYLDEEESVRTVGCETYVQAGYQAQLDSVVLLKNKSAALPLQKQLKLYVPDRHIRPKKGFMRFMEEEQFLHPVHNRLLSEYFHAVSTPEEADAAIVFIESPLTNGGYENHSYVPISLQYRPYQAVSARETSIAGSTWWQKDTNRSYLGKTVHAANEEDLVLVINTKKAMKEKPVIVCITMHNPTVCSEFEPYADAILCEFGVSRQALLDLIIGAASPKGRLPVQLPLNMETVERHCEDVAFDLTPYTDEEGHVYDYGYGIDFSGALLKQQ